MSESAVTRCIECGGKINEDNDAVYGGGKMEEAGAERLTRGETVDASELFGFDDGPYCSIRCSVRGGDDGE